jgi:hypothetical protein
VTLPNPEEFLAATKVRALAEMEFVAIASERSPTPDETRWMEAGIVSGITCAVTELAERGLL